jgi:hypothetical protein
MQNLSSSEKPTNPSKALIALEKFHVARERARQEIQVEITREEKALQRIRFTLGQAILDDPTLRENAAAILPPELKERVNAYVRGKARIETLRKQKREAA